MKPSVEAITAALKAYYDTAGDWIPKGMDDALEAAYAIDVDPMQEEYNGVIERLEGRIREKDKEIERLTKMRFSEQENYATNMKLATERIDELEAQVTALRDDLQGDIESTVTQHRRIAELEAEIERLQESEVRKVAQQLFRNLQEAQRRNTELEVQNARLREVVEIYVPKTEVPK